MIKNYFWIIALLLCACGKNEKAAPALFQLVEGSGIDFTNTVHNSKDFNIFSYRNFYNGGGVAIGDVNNDGLPDVFFTANMGDNKLYLNKGSWKFEDITDKAGFKHSGKWGTGVVMVDLNNDGWLDIYVCNAGYQAGVSNENELYINNQNGTFTEKAAQYGLAENGYTTHAAFFDYDGDGDLDCYVLKNSFIPVNTLNYANKRDLRAEDWPVKDFLKGGGDKLLRNDGGHFTDVSKKANIYGSLIGFGLGVTIGDVNGDHFPDIYISNDFFERDYLYINKRDGTFSEELEGWMQHISHSSMGADIADINNDGFPDIFTTDMLPGNDHRLRTTTSFENWDVNQLKIRSGFYNQFQQNTLQVNNGGGQFLETAFFSGVAATDWSWGGLFFDADNDGLSDLFVCNGIYHDVTDQDFIDFFANDVIQNMVMTGQKEDVDQIIDKMPSRPIPNNVFKNRGGLRFTEEGAAWGLAQPSFSNGAAYGDLDGDGDLDLVVNNVNMPAFVYRNKAREQQKGSYIGIRLQGTEGNTFAIGSKISVFTPTGLLTRELMPSRGFQSSVDYKQVIGLGTALVDSVVITWPDRTYTTLIKPATDTVHLVRQGNKSRPLPVQRSKPEVPLLTLADSSFEKHTEDDYVDFYTERNVPVLLSREGPKAAVADVNRDGLEDVYISGAAGGAGQLYLQGPGGKFVKKENSHFDRAAPLEDVAALFFDVESDGDPDLFVGACISESMPYSGTGQNRIYINDGKGNFTPSPNALPGASMNTTASVAADMDGDGDTDLFIGGRNIPQGYGLDPQSALYINDGKGNFTNALAGAKGADRLGMIAGAAWIKWSKEANALVVAGEWMAPKFLQWQNGTLRPVPTTLDSLHGWWQALRAADLDGDGDDDLVLGNIGENFYLRPSATAPAKLWVADFDGNGIIDKVLSRTVDGRDMPVFLKRDVTDQIVSLRKENLKHEQFASKAVQDLFPAGQLNNTRTKIFNFPASIIAWNEGGGRFAVQALPTTVQLSSLNAILCTDVNRDGRLDLLLGGNQFGILPQFGRLDASFGQVLINKGNRNFEVRSTGQSGVALHGQVRDIVAIGGKGQKGYLFLQNNQKPVLFRLNPPPPYEQR